MSNTKEPPTYNKHLKPTLRVGAKSKVIGFAKHHHIPRDSALFRRSV